MAISHDDPIDHLSSILAARSEGYVREFEAALAALGPLDDPKFAARLALLLDDDEPYEELMFSLVHFIEQLPTEPYIACLLSAAPTLAKTSPYWATILLIRVLNGEQYRLELVRQLRRAPPASRLAIKSLAESLTQEDPKFLAKAVVVLVAASEGS